MKKRTLFTAALFAATFASAQDYTFSVLNQPYQELVGATSLTQGQVWDDPSLVIPIGFDFEYFNTHEDTIYIENGLGADLEFMSPISGVYRILGATDEDIIDRGYTTGDSDSDISYKLEGTAPNRILKIQWKNVGFYYDYDDDGVCQDFANFQVWLFETSMKVEYHYGLWSVTQPQISLEFGNGPIVLFLDEYDGNAGTVNGLYELWGSSANPTINTDGNLMFANSLQDIPANGTVYRFSKNYVGLNEMTKTSKNLEVYPNPASAEFKVNAQIETVVLTDMNGKTWFLSLSNGAYSLEGIPAGVYIVEAKGKEGVYRQKLIVQ